MIFSPSAATRLASRARCRRAVLAVLVFLSQALVNGAALSAGESIQKYPDVVAATARISGPDTYDFDVTVSSPYDTPERYADAFRAMGSDGTVFGVRTLFHDHATEQPFTRDLYGVKIPASVRTVVIQARDRKHGYGGKTVELALPGR